MLILRIGERSNNAPAAITPSTPIRMVSRRPMSPPSIPASRAPIGATPWDKNCKLTGEEKGQRYGCGTCRQWNEQTSRSVDEQCCTSGQTQAEAPYNAFSNEGAHECAYSTRCYEKAQEDRRSMQFADDVERVERSHKVPEEVESSYSACQRTQERIFQHFMESLHEFMPYAHSVLCHCHRWLWLADESQAEGGKEKRESVKKNGEGSAYQLY